MLSRLKHISAGNSIAILWLVLDLQSAQFLWNQTLDNVRSTTQDAALKDQIFNSLCIRCWLLASCVFRMSSPCRGILSHEAMMIIFSIIFVLIENGMLEGETVRVWLNRSLG